MTRSKVLAAASMNPADMAAAVPQASRKGCRRGSKGGKQAVKRWSAGRPDKAADFVQMFTRA
jgi:hypothetical protein